MLQVDCLRHTTGIRWPDDCCVFPVTWTAGCVRPEIRHRPLSYDTAAAWTWQARVTRDPPRCSCLRRRATLLRPVRRLRRRSEVRRSVFTDCRPLVGCCRRPKRSTKAGVQWLRRTSLSYRDPVRLDRILLRRRRCCHISTSLDSIRRLQPRQRPSSSSSYRDRSPALGPSDHITRSTPRRSSTDRRPSPPRRCPPTLRGFRSRLRPSWRRPGSWRQRLRRRDFISTRLRWCWVPPGN